MKKCESEKHKCWGLAAEGFVYRWLSSGYRWKVGSMWLVSGAMDYDEELGPLHGMYVSMEADLEVQRTIKRAELTGFLCLLKKVIGPIKVHVDNKGIIDRLRRGGRQCINPKAGNADLWIKIWEELHLLTSKEVLVEHVKAHRTQKGQERCRNLRSLSLRAMRKRMS